MMLQAQQVARIATPNPQAVTAAEYRADMEEVDFHFQRRSYSEAVTTLDRVISSFEEPKFLGEAWWKRGKMYLFKAIVGDGGKISPEIKLSFLEEALNSADRSLAAVPAENHFAWFYKGMALLKISELRGGGPVSGDLDEVRRCLSRSLETHPDYYTAWSTLSSVARKEGNFLEAVAFDRRCTAFSQADYYSFLKLARSLYARNWDSGERIIRQQGQKIQLAEIADPYERGLHYEGEMDFSEVPPYSNAIAYNKMSDREEALFIVDWVIALAEGEEAGDPALAATASQLKARFLTN